MSEKKTSLDPRIKRTLQMIAAALLALMEEKGFAAVTVRDITERAGINRATFYLHYQDKYDLLEKTVEEMFRLFTEEFQLPPDFATDDFIKDTDTPPSSFLRQFEHIAEHAHFYRVMLGANGLPGFAKRMEDVIHDSLRRRSVIAQPDDSKLAMPREIIVRYVASAHLGIIMYWLEEEMVFSPNYMALQLIRLHMLGSTHFFTPGSEG